MAVELVKQPSENVKPNGRGKSIVKCLFVNLPYDSNFHASGGRSGSAPGNARASENYLRGIRANKINKYIMLTP
jgi:hypothetical protein